MDSGTNTSTGSVNYTVVAPTDLAIANVALSKVATGSTLTYAIGVGNLGKRKRCQRNGERYPDPRNVLRERIGQRRGVRSRQQEGCPARRSRFPCVSAGPSGASKLHCRDQFIPLSISSLNGAVIKVVVNVTAAAGTTLKDTATVSAANLDPKPSNNSSTARTTVSAH